MVHVLTQPPMSTIAAGAKKFSPGPPTGLLRGSNPAVGLLSTPASVQLGVHAFLVPSTIRITVVLPVVSVPRRMGRPPVRRDHAILYAMRDSRIATGIAGI